MGGFVDGIVLHQILQWHQMLSAKLPPDTLLNKEVNMFWDGIFHAFTWLTTAVGIGLLWRLIYRRDAALSNRIFVGGLFFGFGLFNVVEGLIDHHLLKLHNVREISESQGLWNWGFILVSLLMLAGSWLAIQKGRRDVHRQLPG
ncbi:putative membrane protein [Cesiribacter andamanensis AMV16]|uniref:Putative membrane protein n=2 Tax=Cesiribacter TaxID=1133570 RepID=M7MYL5_9BACT|nr:putative membrane protein [Cesiribacter andamanensis AMV16]